MPDGSIAPVSSNRTAMAGDRVSGDRATVDQSVSAEMPSSAPVGPASGPRALIYQPCRSAMASGGKARARPWVLEFERRSPSIPDPLMGWSSSEGTPSQIRLRFPSREASIAYACRNGINATVVPPHPPKPILRSYASNFIGGGTAGVYGRFVPPDDG